MSTPTSPTTDNGNGPTSPLRRLGVAIGALIVVGLTVIIAIFLALFEDGEGTPTVQQDTPTPTLTPTLPPPPPTFTPSPTDLATATFTPTPTPTMEPTVLAPAAPTSTFTPAPPPTFTPTPSVIIVTATPGPVSTPTRIGGVCQPPPDWVTYQAQPGDTLNSLARRVNSSVFELQQVNCLASVNLDVGQTIFLPFTPPTPTVTSTPAAPTLRPPATPTRTPTAVRPVVDDVVPDRVDENTAQQEVVITVLGRNFNSRAAGFKVELRGPESRLLQLGQARSDTSFDAIVPPGLPVGIYDIVVTNPNSDRAGVKESAYVIGEAPPTVTPSPRPRITNFSPQSGNISDEVTLTVTGFDFQPNDPNFEVKLQRGGSEFILDVGTLRTSTSFEAIIRPQQLTETGDYDLVVTNPDGQSDIADDEYRAEE